MMCWYRKTDQKEAQKIRANVLIVFFIGKFKQVLDSRFCRIEVFPFKKEILDS